MQNTWMSNKLKEVTTKIGSGATPRGGQSAYLDEGIPLIRSLNIYDLQFSYADLAFINDEQARRLSNVTVEKDDVLLNITGASVCRCTSVPDSLVPARVNQHVAIIRADRKQLDGKYLKYVLVSPLYKRALLGLATTGATREALTKSDLENLELKLPEIKSQSRIASVLSAYDDLIENNEKRIKILEEMAQRLYTEWFVKFKFPGHEKVKMVESGTQYGKIPEGWEVRRLGDITSVITKGTTPTTMKKSFVEKGINFIKIESVGDNGEIMEDKLAKIDQDTHDLLSRSQLQSGDVLFSIAGAIGRTTLITPKLLPANTNQALAIIRSKEEEYGLYLYQVISSLDFLNLCKGRVVQTAQANVSLSVLASVLILFPDIKELIVYNKVISPIFEMISKMRGEIRILEKTRDLLIPLLVTGKRELKCCT
ncbi:MAG: restriction endonuclease subunit S [Candidatus Margulisiibacteriota bacterium]